MEVVKIDNEKIKKAIRAALANLMLEEDFCLEVENIEDLETSKNKVLTFGGKKNG